MINDIQPYKGRSLDVTQKVRVYRDRTRSGVVYSVQQKNRVIGHTSNISIKDGRCIIYHRAQVRIRETKKRQVHAYVEGYLTTDVVAPQYTVNYNPFTYDYFYTNDHNKSLPLAISGGEHWTFTTTGVTVTGAW